MSDNELAIIGDVKALKRENQVLKKQIEKIIEEFFDYRCIECGHEPKRCPEYVERNPLCYKDNCFECWINWSREKAEKEIANEQQETIIEPSVSPTDYRR